LATAGRRRQRRTLGVECASADDATTNWIAIRLSRSSVSEVHRAGSADGCARLEARDEGIDEVERRIERVGGRGELTGLRSPGDGRAAAAVNSDASCCIIEGAPEEG
jgi:hypothetical protein